MDDIELKAAQEKLKLQDKINFADWISDKSYKKCANGEWIELGTGDYKIVAQSIIELYNIFKHSSDEEKSIVYNFKCNKCGTGYRFTDDKTFGCCRMPAEYRTSGICGGEIIMVD